MVFEALRREEVSASAGGSFIALFTTAIGTSLDAMAVGVSLAFLGVNIWVVAAATGLATFCIATGHPGQLNTWPKILSYSSYKFMKSFATRLRMPCRNACRH